MNELILTVAGVGAELMVDTQPNLPVTPELLARDAKECAEAGAAIYHLHVRDRAGLPTMERSAYKEGLEAIRSTTDLIVQFSSGGAVGDTENDRIGPLDLRPEMATLTTGTVNFGEEVFHNPPALVRRFYDRMRELDIAPEFEIFDSGMVATAERIADGSDHHLHFDLVLGVAGGMPAWDDSVSFLSAHLPEGSTWSATGIGRAHEGVARAAIERGGHVRTGFEDVLYVARGEKARSNAELIEKAAAMGQKSGRHPAGPLGARRILGLTGSA
jgi:3-keto-5-aminohexanoate cleavage enzyme